MRSLAVKMGEMVGCSRGDDNVRVPRVTYLFVLKNLHSAPLILYGCWNYQAHRSPLTIFLFI